MHNTNKNTVNDIQDVRRKRLHLYKEHTEEAWKVIAKRAGMSESRLSQIRNGHRPFAEKTARTMERKLHVSEGFFDIREDVSNSGPMSQSADNGLLVRVITAIDSAVKTSRKDFKTKEQYGRVVEFAYEDSRGRGFPDAAWFSRLVKLLLE